jgi:hypothetical protein
MTVTDRLSRRALQGDAPDEPDLADLRRPMQMIEE